MKQWKPLVASLVVIALAMGALAAWKHLGPTTGPAPANDNRAASDPPPANGEPSGLKYQAVPFEKLPELDPLGLWPRNGQRMSSVEFWVMWQTAGFSKCRLLGTSDQRDWFDLGSTGGEDHCLQASLAYFGSAVTFAVEFDAGGTRYRSAPRTVYFGQGAHFARRSHEFTPGDAPGQTFPLEVFGRNPRRLSLDAFLAVWFPQELVTFVAHGREREGDDGGEVLFGVQDPAVLEGRGCQGFLEVYDVVTDTYDRTRILIRP
jgi:hypothetical protein